MPARLLSLLLLFGAILCAFTAAPTQTSDDGEKVYLARCMSCHQTDGMGIEGVFPPLVDTEWVTGDKGRLIRIVLDGMMGEVKVNRVVYSGSMPPWKSFLTDEEAAALLTYIRGAWGNDASSVTAEQVALVRKATADRSTPWTIEELMQPENHGIPGSLGSLFARPDSTQYP